MSKEISTEVVKVVSSGYIKDKGQNPNSAKKIMHSTKEAATALGVAEGTLNNLRSQGRGPRFYKVGRKVLYKESDLLAWACQCPVQTLDSHNLGQE